ncbi:MAG: hypothetical protein ACFB01_14815 [Cohaesibacteraceae bacterium]
MTDFNDYSKAQREVDRRQDLDDFNNELAGREVGRISRFLTRSDDNTLTGGKRGHKDGGGLSALDIILGTSPDYFTLHADLSGDIRVAQARNHDLDQRLEAALDAARHQMETVLDQAVVLRSGERAFLDENGVAWTEDDRRIDPAITEGIDWTGRPDRSAYRDARDALTDLQDAQDENRDLGVRLGDIDNAIHDEDNPATMDEMEDLYDEVEAIEEQIDRIDQSLNRLHEHEPAEPGAFNVEGHAVPQL